MNPYVSRGPVRSAEMFFGRGHELNEIAAFLRGNQSVSIIGPRKIGKTSLLFHLQRPALWPTLGLDADNLFVYLDCEVLGEGTPADIFMQFAGEMAAALDTQGLPPEPALDNAQNKPSRLSFEAAVRKLNQRGLRVVLILDEFERLSANAGLDVNFFNALRSAAGRYQLVFLTASARPLIELTYSGRSQEILSSPFFNIFAPLFLGLLSEPEARPLITGPAQHAGVTFTPEIVDFIYQLVGGYPLGLQVACFHAFEHPNSQSAIEERVSQELAAHFEYYWRNLNEAEQDVLRHMNDAVTRAASDTTLRGVIRDLVQKCLIVAEPTTMTYRYPSRAWEDFVATQMTGTTLATRTGGLLTGAHLGQYAVLEPLGRGGMAEVYKGRHLRLERTVAIKVLPARLANESDFRARFEREARAIAALQHPHIVQVFDFGDVEGVYYMVMEYIQGQDLAHHLREHGALPLTEFAPILQEVASALDFAHGQGFVHRDVKPSNVMLAQNSTQVRAVLTDFGIAKIVSGNTAATKTAMVGTLDYMAPEQIRAAGEVDGRADVYALGVLAFQALTGHLPFKADNPGAVLIAHLQQSAPDPRTFKPELSNEVARALMRALAKDPGERFATPGLFAQALGGG